MLISRCFTWKNSFVTTGVLFDGGTQEDYLFHDGQTEFKYSPSTHTSRENSRDVIKSNQVTHCKTGKESLDLAILSLSVGDHVVEDLINNKKYLISTNYIEKIVEDGENGVEITITQNDHSINMDSINPDSISGGEIAAHEADPNSLDEFEGHEIDISIYNDEGELKFEDNNLRKNSKQVIIQLPSTDDSLESIAERNAIGSILTNQEVVSGADGLQEVVISDNRQLVPKQSLNGPRKNSQIYPIKLKFTKKSSIQGFDNSKNYDGAQRRMRNMNSATF